MKRHRIALSAALITLGTLYCSAEPLAGSPTEISIQQQYGEYITKAAERYHICPELIEAMIEQESGGEPSAVNTGGDTGLMQINPRWHYDRMDKLNVTDLKDPQGNIMVAADYLSELFGEYGDLPMVLMVYNGVSDAQARWETGNYTDYAVSVMARSEELERIHEKWMQ